MTTTVVSPRLLTWRTPLVIIVCGCLISALTFGPRSALGFFLKPLSIENGWGRDVFALALAFQNLLWGIGQPIAGAVADRFGAVRVLCLGLVIYAIGLGLMGYATTPLQLNLTAGVLIGLGLSGCSFNLVLSAVGKLLPDGWRLLGFGAVTAASSFGQFLFSPLAVALIDQIGWPQTLVVFAGMLVLLLPMTLALVTPRALSIKDGAAAPQSFKQALREAFAYRSYLLLVLGFFTCGFQLAFITVHMPAYLLDRGLSSAV